MNRLDIVILCLLGIGMIIGIYKGTIKQITSLFALIVGIYLCSGVASWLHRYLTAVEWFPPNAVTPVCYFLGFIIIVGVVILAGNILHRLVSATPLSIINHLSGGFIGIIVMIVSISVIINLMEIIDPRSVIISQEIKAQSSFYCIIKKIISDVFPGDLFKLNNVIIT